MDLVVEHVVGVEAVQPPWQRLVAAAGRCKDWFQSTGLSSRYDESSEGATARQHK